MNVVNCQMLLSDCWWLNRRKLIYLRDRTGSPDSTSTADILTDACDFLGGLACSLMFRSLQIKIIVFHA